MSKESDRKTVTIPPELWAKVRVEKIQEGDEFLSDVVVRALRRHFRSMNMKAKVNISHIDSSEDHDTYEDGEFELVKWGDETYLVQIILGDYCAAALIDAATFEAKLAEGEGDEETRLLRIQIVEQEVKFALNDPLEKDELKALYKAYYRTWDKTDLERARAAMEGR